MKKLLSVLLSCVMCSTLLLTACEAAPEESTGTDAQAPIEEMIVGRWMTSLVNGEPALTNDRLVFNVVSPSEVYSSVSLMNVSTLPWHEPELTEFAISEAFIFLYVLLDIVQGFLIRKQL